MKKHWLVTAPIGILAVAAAAQQARSLILSRACQEWFGFVPAYPLSTHDERAMVGSLNEFRSEIALAVVSFMTLELDHELAKQVELDLRIDHLRLTAVESLAAHITKKFANNPERLYNELGLAA